MNAIFCPICGSPYFVNAERHLQITGTQLPPGVYRRCLGCGHEVTFSLQGQQAKKPVESMGEDEGDLL